MATRRSTISPIFRSSMSARFIWPDMPIRSTTKAIACSSTVMTDRWPMRCGNCSKSSSAAPARSRRSSNGRATFPTGRGTGARRGTQRRSWTVMQPPSHPERSMRVVERIGRHDGGRLSFAAGFSPALLDPQSETPAAVAGPNEKAAAKKPDEIVRSIVSAKVANQRAVLQRALRDYGAEMAAEQRDRIDAIVDRLARILRRVAFANEGVDILRGAEGEAAQGYFSVFGDLVRSPDPEIRFVGRSRRPPLDPVNALLSFLYTLLTHHCRSAAEGLRLDPAVGFLHRDRPGRPSLALDLMEELRPVLADRLALSLFNRRQLRARDFETRDGGAVLLSGDVRRTVLTAC